MSLLKVVSKFAGIRRPCHRMPIPKIPKVPAFFGYLERNGTTKICIFFAYLTCPLPPTAHFCTKGSLFDSLDHMIRSNTNSKKSHGMNGLRFFACGDQRLLQHHTQWINYFWGSIHSVQGLQWVAISTSINVLFQSSSSQSVSLVNAS